MKLTHFYRTHYIYEADNIPDHRSRRFGLLPLPDGTSMECCASNKKP